MDKLISYNAAIDAVNTALFPKVNTAKDAEKALRALPPAKDDRLVMIADLVRGTINHFDLDDAMDLLYEIKRIVRDV